MVSTSINTDRNEGSNRTEDVEKEMNEKMTKEVSTIESENDR